MIAVNPRKSDPKQFADVSMRGVSVRVLRRRQLYENSMFSLFPQLLSGQSRDHHRQTFQGGTRQTARMETKYQRISGDFSEFPYFTIETAVFLKATCPVCREAIFCDVDELKTAAPPKQLEKAQKFEVTQDLRLLQQKMQQLFNYQKSKGGIIDIEAEENKLLLITNSNDNTSEETSDVRVI